MAGIDQDPVNAADLARAIEPHAIASWPAPTVRPLDSWLVRMSAGHSGRANSVAAIAFDGRDVEASLQTAESLYREAGLIPQFQVTPAVVPEDLASRLRARGYVADPDSIVMVANAAAVSSAEHGSPAKIKVSFLGPSDGSFAALTIAGSRSVEDGRERLAILERIVHPKACIVLYVDDVPVSSVACVVTGAWAGVYVMRTEVPFRRRGFAARVLREAAIWASNIGAKRLYLQVESENHGARALYARAGFGDGYRYTHWKLRAA